MKKLFVIFCFLFGVLHAQNRVLDSLKLGLKNAKHDTTRCVTLSRMIELEKDYEVWITYNNEVKKLCIKNLEKAPSDVLKKVFTRELANAYNNEGFYNQYKGNDSLAVNNYNKAILLCETIYYQKGLGVYTYNLADLYKQKGAYKMALSLYYKSYKIHYILKDKFGIALAYSGLGDTYEELGDIKKSLKFNNEALKTFEELKDQRGVASILTSIAHIYSNQGDLKKAIEYNIQINRLYVELGDEESEARSLHNLGLLYNQNNEFEKAKECYDKTVSIREKIGDVRGVASTFNNISRLCLQSNDLKKALEYNKKSLKIANDIGNQQLISSCYFTLSEIYNKQKDFDNGKDAAFKGLSIARKINLPSLIKSNALNLYEAQYNLGEYKVALENYKLFVEMRDSIVNEENKKELYKSQLQYVYDKKAIADSINYETKTEFKNIELAKNKAELKAKRNQQYFLFGGLLLFAVFAGFMYNRFKVTQKQKLIIEIQKQLVEEQKHIVEEKHKEITESVEYAERIQQGYFTTIDFLNEHLKTGFILFKPKDKVSGDFYWSEIMSNGNVAVCIADSTGHGVPGAFMSLLNISLLNESVFSRKDTDPGEVLNFARKILLLGMRKNNRGEGGNDGMDCVLFSINYKTLELQFSGANNNLWIVRCDFDSAQSPELIELKGDKMPVGRSLKADIPFTSQKFQLQKGDWIYASTDGFGDQFGGEKGKKFMSKSLKDTILSICHLHEDEQKEKLNSIFENWKGDLEQVDDVTVMGIRI